MKYYFLKNKQRVYLRTEEVDLTKFPQFIPLTDEQVEYYLAHPEATRYEIEHAFDPDPEPVPIDLEAYKARARERVSQRSLERMGRLIPSYQVTDAQISLMAIAAGATPIYDSERANAILLEANRIGGLCRAEYYRVVGLIDAAEDAASVDAAESSAMFDDISI